MNFKTEFIQICFRCSADFIQPSFHLFCDVVISWSVSINRALLFLFFDLHCGPELHACTIYIAELFDCMIYAHELKIQLNCWSPSLRPVLFPVVADPSTLE